MAGNQQTPRKFDEALRVGGLTYTKSGLAIDANGVPLEGAPERPEDTPPHEQPHNIAANPVPVGMVPQSGAVDAEALGLAIARGLTLAASGGQSPATTAQSENVAKANELADGAKDAKPSEKGPIVPGSVATLDHAGTPAGTSTTSDVVSTSSTPGSTPAPSGAPSTGTGTSGAGSAGTSGAQGSGTPSGGSSGASASNGGPKGSTND